MGAELEPVGSTFVREAADAGLFGVRVGDRCVAIINLDALELGKVARAAGLSWVALIETPTADLTAAVLLVMAAEAHCGVAEDVAELSVADVLERFVRLPARNGES